MRLKNITIKNFMSIRKADIKLENEGLTLIQGINNDDSAFDSNGAGKSTISEALIWVLYDKTLRGLGGDEIVNRNIGKNCNVILDFEDDSGSQYRVSRYRKHNTHKNECHIFKDKKNITPKSTRDATKLVEEIFGIDFHTFTNSILFGQGVIKMFSTATDKEKKEILEKMLKMDEFKQLQETTKKQLSEKKLELVELNSSETKTQDLIEEVNQTIESLKQAEQEVLTQAEEEVKELKKSLKTAEEDLQNHIKTTNDYTSTLSDLNEMKGRIEKSLEKYRKYEQLKNSLIGDEKALTKENERLLQLVSELRQEMELIASGQGTACPTCGQDITKESIEASLRHVAEKMKETMRVIKLNKEKITSSQQDVTTLDKALTQKDKLSEQKDVIIGEISAINTSIISEGNLRKSLEIRVTDLQSSIKKLEEKKGESYRQLIESKESQLVQLNETLEDIQKSKTDVAEHIKHLEFWVEGFGNAGIKSYLLDGVTHILNKKANEYLSKLSGSTTTIEFSTQTRLANGELRDKFDIKILNSVGGDSYSSNSTGERRRIDLAISLALQDLVMSRGDGKLNFLMYDEIFDGLDAVGCENAIQLLMEIQKNVETIFVITHNDILKAYFDKFLVVKKENGTTEVLTN